MDLCACRQYRRPLERESIAGLVPSLIGLWRSYFIQGMAACTVLPRNRVDLLRLFEIGSAFHILLLKGCIELIKPIQVARRQDDWS